MANTASISANIAGRYAQAVFDLVKEQGGLDQLGTEVAALRGALEDSADLRTLIGSAIYSRAEQEQAIAAVAARMGLSATLANTLRLMARNRRLFALPQLVARLAELIADARGEVTAEVVSAARDAAALVHAAGSKMKDDVMAICRVNQLLVAGANAFLADQALSGQAKMGETL